MAERLKQPMPIMLASTPQMCVASMQQALVMTLPKLGGFGQLGAAGSGGMHMAPLDEPQTPFTGSAQHAGRIMIGRPIAPPGGSCGVMHTVGPQGIGAAPPPLVP